MTEGETQALLANAADALGSPLCVLDASGTVVAVNQAWRDFALHNGASPSHAIGQNYLAQCDAANPVVAPGSAEIA